jgi:hypothetical protein
MARPRPEKKREPVPPAEQRVLPDAAEVGNCLVDATGEDEGSADPTRPLPGRMPTCECSASTSLRSR